MIEQYWLMTACFLSEVPRLIEEALLCLPTIASEALVMDMTILRCLLAGEGGRERREEKRNTNRALTLFL